MTPHSDRCAEPTHPYSRRRVLGIAAAATAVAAVPFASAAPAFAATPGTAGSGRPFDPRTRWMGTASSAANQWTAYRRSLDLPGAPVSAPARIAADTKYWLWINDQMVVFEGGLKRGPNPNDTYCDEIDLAPYLRQGTNTLAVLVWYFGKNGFSHQDSGRAGLLFECVADTPDGRVVVPSGTDWKASVHPGYRASSGGGQPNYRLPESNVHYDARQGAPFDDWTGPGFDDASWPAATDLGPAGAAPWNALVARPIPFFRHSGLLDYTNQADLPATGTGGTPIVATLPSNLQVTPYLKVDAPAGAVIGIQTDHYRDGGEANVRSTYVTTGGVQEFESLGWMSGTDVRYTIPEGVRVLALKYRESGYDTDFTGSFSSSDAFFDVLWGKAARTMYLNMRDTYFDCPTRERAQWWGDVVNQLKEGFYTFDHRSHALGRKAIRELAAWQKPDGALYSPVPAGNWKSELPTQMLASVWSFQTFHLYTGDEQTVASVYPQVKAYLKLWSMDADGLVRHRSGDWDWEDWGSQIDARVLDNAWFHLALDSAITLARLSGNDSDIPTWRALQVSIERNFDRVLWDAGAKAYRSPGYRGDTDDRGNALAVVAGLADPVNHDAITTVLLNHINASPYLEFYVLEALYLMRRPDVAESRMRRRYAQQVADPGYTLWEVWDKRGGTDNHAWNGGPLYALSAYAAGVRPTEPGYRSFEVLPQPGGFGSFRAVVPSVRGRIAVEFTRAEDRVELSVLAPPGAPARIGVPVFGGADPSVTVRGRTVFSGGEARGGVPGLRCTGRDEDYVYVEIDQPGRWEFGCVGAGVDQAPGDGDNLALYRPVTSNDSLEIGEWSAFRLTNGSTTGTPGDLGYTSNFHTSADVSAAPLWVEIDLGADKDLSEVVLHPRTDTTTADGLTCGFPVDFTIQVRASGASSATVARTVTGEPNPAGAGRSYTFDRVRARYVRLQVTRLGPPARDEGGANYHRLQLTEFEVRNPS
ncbi:glycoside hydrolase family 78 [Wenjunlia vitaminophila]|uniref:Glycoside hydrolase family 78 n=1 Tax=Wenjunlia vitaminophila TaxID=76728 RepID=A0A0T6LQB4_WENVI|nr:alpha-L-rhamnosidase C-terminal domain-containing protein [Wenjunlia vitaminophila]KRV48184.1 glycoside hydrolase family 78 [Wenjunlia vitaminophila]